MNTIDPAYGTPGRDEEFEAQLDELRQHISYLEQSLQAISSGGVDAVLLGEPGHEEIYTLTSADRPYRAIVESMGEGAATVSQGGVVLYANATVASFLGVERDTMIGRDFTDFVDASRQDDVRRLLDAPVTDGSTRRTELLLASGGGEEIPFLVTLTGIDIDDVHVHCLVLTDLTLQKQIEQQQARRAAEDERQRVVREVNDTIVQGLVTAEMAFDLEKFDLAREAIASTSERARAWIGELAEGRLLEPGMAVRSTPATRGPVTHD